MKSFLYLDTAGDHPAFDLNVIFEENGESHYMGDEVDVSAEQVADWKYVLGKCEDSDPEFTRVQTEMRLAWNQAYGREAYKPRRVSFAVAVESSDGDPADWWKA